MKALILCAGYATRMYPLTLTKSKNLLQIGGKVMVEHIVEKLNKIPNLDKIYIISNAKFYEDFRLWAKKQEKIVVLNDGTWNDKERLGAIGDIKFAIENIEDDEFLIIAGDNLFEFDLFDFVSYGKKNGITVGIKKIENLDLIKKYSQVLLDKEKRIIYFEEKPQNPTSNLTAICLYYFPKGFLKKYINEYIKEGKNPDQAGLFIQFLHKKIDVYGFIFEDTWFDIGDIGQFHCANFYLLEKELQKIFGKGERPLFFIAPGRVNIIGEHTDYNGGYVMPFAVDRFIYLGARKNHTNKVNFISLQFKDAISVNLDDIRVTKTWVDYPLGVISVLKEYGYKVDGVDLIYESNIPIGGGLSSSGAIEVITLTALNEIFDFKIEKQKIPILCQKAENEFVGARCGIMDQFIITMAKKERAILLNCRNLEFDYVPVNLGEFYFLISSTNVSHSIASGEYNKRRAECEEGLRILKNFIDIETISDLKKREFEKYKNKLPENIRKRIKHVVEENQRVLEAKEALLKGDVVKLGDLLNASHISLRDLYEVSCKEVEIMREESLKIDGVLGCRITGGGFGGCLISLIHKDSIEKYIKEVRKNYTEKTGIIPEFHVCQIVDGCSIFNFKCT
ncbi:MAG: galactokinase [Candidatus Omnitrophica bacterium]|nr:galactokinase [Candidatus Omnitrophota bacterium]MCM8806549.1 galactokinase [Candidatus Omnitrophota bacterium]